MGQARNDVVVTVRATRGGTPTTWRPIVLPTLVARRWAYADLDAEARARHGTSGPNPLLDPVECARFVDGVADRLGVDHTFGGYLEDRAALWRGHYHAEGQTLHLGVDLNAPAGTPVASACAGEVSRVVRDPDQGGGWGGLVFVRMDVPHHGARHVLYGHLAHAGLPEVGRRLAAGEVFATIGIASENGGWFPHLHVQCFDQGAFDRHWPRLEAMDGYGPEIGRPRPDVPDPTDLVMAQRPR